MGKQTFQSGCVTLVLATLLNWKKPSMHYSSLLKLSLVKILNFLFGGAVAQPDAIKGYNATCCRLWRAIG